MIIEYGISTEKIDVTEICKQRLVYGKHIVIPPFDNQRAFYFTDPIPNVPKNIFITIQRPTTNTKETIEYEQGQTIYIPFSNPNRIYINDEKLEEIQRSLILNHGTFQEELPEQRMANKYLTGTEKVLELGGNIGRNSLIIGRILETQGRLVTMECDPIPAELLRENRDINHLDFHIEVAALSKRRLIQKGWQTIVLETPETPETPIPQDYTEVATIDFQTLQNKYNIVFDTLVLDCEGAFYYILKDMPYILDNITLILVENDYTDIQHKIEIDATLTDHHFYIDYQERGGWGPCEDRFFEVWKRYPPQKPDKPNSPSPNAKSYPP
jgi:FkbM family methyltransferase